MPNTGLDIEMVEGEFHTNATEEDMIEDSRDVDFLVGDTEEDFVLGTTKGGKNLLVCKHPNMAGYYFRFGGGGQIPASIAGSWTSFHKAQEVGRVYLENN